jgi:S1-C subfamily serine protease
MKASVISLAACAGLLAATGFRVDTLNQEIERLRSEFDRRPQAAPAPAAAPVAAAPKDLDGLQRDVLAPSVQVNAKGSVGGGTLLSSRENRTYVVTAFHVVSKLAGPGSDRETREPADVTLYDAGGEPEETVAADLVEWNEGKDLALLRLRSVKEYPRVSRLASRETLRAVRVFTPIYAVGCPLGHDPLPTLGEIATLHKEVKGERFWMMNAPTIFGNSGGGIFHRESRELIGVSVMVCTYEGAVATPVPHLGVLVSLEAVYDWLDGLGLRCIYDPGVPSASCSPDRP